MKRDHPPGVLGREPANCIQLADLIRAKPEFDGCQILLELIETSAPMMTDVTNGLARTQASGHRGDAGIVDAGYGTKHIEDTPGALLIHHGKVERCAPRVLGLLTLGGVFAGQKAAGERTPDQKVGALVIEERNDLAFEVAAVASSGFPG